VKSLVLVKRGVPEPLELRDLPKPEPRSGQVRVRVIAAAFNHVDLYMRDSGAGITHNLPLILGVDGAGTIDAVGPGVTGVEPDQPVVIYPALYCGTCEFCRRGEQMLCLRCKLLGEHVDGTFTEFICVPADNVHPIPTGVSFGAAATLPTATLTAWRMVVTQARVRPTETVLIHGIGGGVSLAALAFVKMSGATAIVTSSSRAKLEHALTQGADAVIFHPEEDVLREVMRITSGRGVDVVLENVGADTWPISMRAVRRGGRIVICGATSGAHPSADLQRIFIRQLQITGCTLGSQDEFRSLLMAAGQGRFSPTLHKTYALDEAVTALATLERAGQFGKLILHVASDVPLDSRA
jgi:NADPH:quinone reductase-like Zn-dependent oxidoreductase